MLPSVLLLLAAASSVSAHFKIVYPPWRSDSLENEAYSQFTYPCAGVPGMGNRTDWPVAGGSLNLDLFHHASYLFINLGLGENVTNFNYTLTLPTFWNETGNGTLCVPQITLPSDLSVTDGQAASLQIVTVGEAGEALYNCADITFRTSDISAYGGGNCTTSEGVSYTVVQGSDNNSATETQAALTTASGTASAASAAATSGAAPGMPTGAAPAWVAAAAMAAAFVWGMGM